MGVSSSGTNEGEEATPSMFRKIKPKMGRQVDEVGTEEIDAKKLSEVSRACRNDTSCVEA